MDDRNYDEWSRAAYIATSLSGGKKSVADLIGEHPSKKRERERKKKQQTELDNDALRKIASDKGLNPKF